MSAETVGCQAFNDYSRATNLFRSIAESEVGIPLPDQVLNAWRQTLITMRIADNAIDNTHNAQIRKHLVRQALAFLGDEETKSNQIDCPELTSALPNLKKVLNEFDPHVRNEYLRNLRRLCETSEEIKTVRDAQSLAYLNKMEGQLCSRLFLCLLPQEYREQDGFGKFKKTFTRLGRFGNILDTAIDMRQDYGNSEITVRPTVANRLALLSAGFGDFSYAASHLNPATTRMIGKAILRQVF